jgi:hypothetical protein
MSEIFTKLVVNCSTGESQILPLTQEEINELEEKELASAQRQVEREAVEAAKIAAKASAQAKLSALGLTEEEIAALTE